MDWYSSYALPSLGIVLNVLLVPSPLQRHKPYQPMTPYLLEVTDCRCATQGLNSVKPCNFSTVQPLTDHSRTKNKVLRMCLMQFSICNVNFPCTTSVLTTSPGDTTLISFASKTLSWKKSWTSLNCVVKAVNVSEKLNLCLMPRRVKCVKENLEFVWACHVTTAVVIDEHCVLPDSFEAESVSLQTLVSHPIYVKAARSHKKQALKAVKSQDSVSGVFVTVNLACRGLLRDAKVWVIECQHVWLDLLWLAQISSS